MGQSMRSLGEPGSRRSGSAVATAAPWSAMPMSLLRIISRRAIARSSPPDHMREQAGRRDVDLAGGMP